MSVAVNTYVGPWRTSGRVVDLLGICRRYLLARIVVKESSRLYGGVRITRVTSTEPIGYSIFIMGQVPVMLSVGLGTRYLR